MSSGTTNMLNIQVSTANAMTGLNSISQAGIRTTSMFDNLTESIGECAFVTNNISQKLQNLYDKLDSAIAPGVALNNSLTNLSIVAGVTGKSLKEIEGYARDAAKAFGGSAADGAESYKLILAQLSPEIAKVPKALALMGEKIAITSKIMGGDTRAAAELLTTAMNQFQVSLDDPIQAAGVMGDMMNIMAAAAKAGSAGLPQIKAALEQSGMAAKMAGVSFAETNAAIQVLDKAGKKGSEGGAALRNVMTTLAQGSFLPQNVQQELSAAGIDIDSLTDKTLSLSERLKPLRGIMHDETLMAKLFGKENSNAAVALLSEISVMESYTSAIQGTNTAVEQAGVIMGGYSEIMSRQKAWVDDLKITLFNFTGELMPYIKGVITFFQSTASVMMGVNAIASFAESAWMVAIKGRTKALLNGTKAILSTISSMGFYNALTLASVATTYAFSFAIKAVSKAIYSIPIIGWIAAGISLVITAFKILWDKCEGFRQGMFAIFEVVKAVFYNIGIVVKSVWDNMIKPYIMFWWDIAKTVASGIFSSLQWCWDGIVSGFTIVSDFFVFLWDGVMSGASAIGDFFSGIWNWITETCGLAVSFISSAFSKLVEPIKAVFAPVLDFVSGIFNKISEVFGKFFGWIGNMWNKLFPKDKFKDLGEAAESGLEKGRESWRKSQDEKKKQPETPVAEIPETIENIVIPRSYKTTGRTKEITETERKSETVNLNSIKGSTSYDVIAAKMAPVQINNLAAQSTGQNSIPKLPVAGMNMTDNFNPVKQEYKEGKKDHLQDIALNVRKIAAGITLFASLSATISPKAATLTVPSKEHSVTVTQAFMPPQAAPESISVAVSENKEDIASVVPKMMTGPLNMQAVMSYVPNTKIPKVAEIPELALPAKNEDVRAIPSSMHRSQENSRETTGVPSFAKFCDNVVIHVPVGTTDPQQIAEYVKKEIMTNLNNKLNDGY